MLRNIGARNLLTTVVVIGFGVLPRIAAAAAPSPHSSATSPAPPPLLLGTAWYPEQWPESRWEKDAQLMQEAHIHVVRVAEFAWSRLEPTEGHYDLDWLERAINLVGEHGIYTVLGTPTATPPAWLTQKYPETLRMDEDGRREEHGNRLQYNFDNPKYREFCRDIAGRLAQRFGHNRYVIGWQIDNEYSQSSTDADTKKDFESWLHQRYGSIDALNERWSTQYWSEYYNDWSQIPIPKHAGVDNGNPGLLMNWRRFVSETLRSYQKVQIDAIRQHADTRQFITTNTMGWFVWYDHYTTQQDLDFSVWDDYVPNGKIDAAGNGAIHDLTRGLKRKNFWVMETQPGFVNWSNVNPSLDRGAVRALAWHAVAHGAEAVSYWQWRSALNGQEQYHGTLLGADGNPVPIYSEVQKEGEEFEHAGNIIKDTVPQSQLAILHSWESRWAIWWQPQTDKFDPIAEIIAYYRPLREITQSIDVISPSAPLVQYRVVVAPALNMINDEDAKNLISYVRGGGNLVLGPRSGMKDSDNSLRPERQPGPLADLLGGRVEQFYALIDPVPTSGAIASGNARIWAELLSASSPETEVLLRYGKSNGWLDDQPAMLTRKIGKGSITYIGACFDDKGMAEIARWMQQQFGLTTPLRGVPTGVEASQRYGTDHIVTFLVNFSGSEQDVSLPAAMDDVLESRRVQTVHLSKYGVAVLSRHK
jgi:beta-galactosidase